MTAHNQAFCDTERVWTVEKRCWVWSKQIWFWRRSVMFAWTEIFGAEKITVSIAGFLMTAHLHVWCFWQQWTVEKMVALVLWFLTRNVCFVRFFWIPSSGANENFCPEEGWWPLVGAYAYLQVSKVSISQRTVDKRFLLDLGGKTQFQLKSELFQTEDPVRGTSIFKAGLGLNHGRRFERSLE